MRNTLQVRWGGCCWPNLSEGSRTANVKSRVGDMGR